MTGTDINFFKSLPAFEVFSGIVDDRNYHAIPEGWSLVVADIVNSTGAVQEGRYKAVNMVGAAVISGVLNACDDHELPFVFGGDGAVVAVPAEYEATARAEIAAVITWASENYGLQLRGAVVPVRDIRLAGHDVRLARYRASPYVVYAMFSGGGTLWAERRMKAGEYAVAPAAPGSMPDLAGLSCRWMPAKSHHGAVASIIAVPTSGEADAPFMQLIADIVAITARLDRASHPLPAEGPTFGMSKAALTMETQATAPKAQRFARRLAILFQYHLATTLYRLGMSLGGWNPIFYRRSITLNSDFRKFDDGLKMTVDIDEKTLGDIRARLSRSEAEGICKFGIFVQDSALITCFVPTPLSNDHVHFIDGANGGYAMAAAQIKAAAITP